MRVELDTREDYNPGWKYNYWEQKGVPLRIELGPKDLEKEQVVFARRDDASPSGKMTVKWSEVAARAPEMLETIQAALLEKARKERDAHIRYVNTWEEFMNTLDGNMVLAPWCERIECEEEVKKRTSPDATEKKVVAGEAPALSGSAKTLCLPFNQEELPEDCKCFCCGQKATAFALWGRSYWSVCWHHNRFPKSWSFLYTPICTSTRTQRRIQSEPLRCELVCSSRFVSVPVCSP